MWFSSISLLQATHLFFFQRIPWGAEGKRLDITRGCPLILYDISNIIGQLIMAPSSILKGPILGRKG
jgi:hypothetical protein